MTITYCTLRSESVVTGVCFCFVPIEVNDARRREEVCRRRQLRRQLARGQLGGDVLLLEVPPHREPNAPTSWLHHGEHRHVQSGAELGPALCTPHELHVIPLVWALAVSSGVAVGCREM
eukprot:CAMPEP_0202822852 /NCGR_PEP_ID=MMETSP1389-20130828/11365_1 /ASSEMBLY_ACC=CAM_ASM_000865 /TAXON_ID=302021 /ORGANISM="Rhodomonas sp., Strain CCMP768" /LENGTH=118 /DNA_ID=CAMNT_0049495813 /DNA_START=196 /DNA_END=553 /DNA_ORIENTATION=-